MTFLRKISFLVSFFSLQVGSFEALAISANQEAVREDAIHIGSLDFDNALYTINQKNEGILQTDLYCKELVRLGVLQIFYGSSRGSQQDEIFSVQSRKGESYTRFLEFHEALNRSLEEERKAQAKFFPLIMEDVFSPLLNIFSKKELREKGAFFNLLHWAKREAPEAVRPLETLSGRYTQSIAESQEKSRFSMIGRANSTQKTPLSKKRESCKNIAKLGNKEDMLFLQMQVAAHHYWHSPKEIYFHFYDDNTQILARVQQFFEAHRELIPSRVTLLLHHVGNTPFTSEERTTLNETPINERDGYSFAVIKGTGLSVPTVSIKNHIRKIQRNVKRRT